MSGRTTEHESPIRIGRTSPAQPALLQGPLEHFLEARGVLVEVYLDPTDAAYHVRAPLSERPAWRCSFPYGLRQAEARYLVEELRPDVRGFWRTRGRIWRVEDGRAVEDVTPPRPRRKNAARR